MIKKLFLAMTIFLTLFMSLNITKNASAKSFTDSNERIVKVGYYEFPGYHDIFISGEKSGYGYEYLQEMKKYANWKYEYRFNTFEESLELLKNGELDILTGLSYTAERAKYLDYSDMSMGIEDTILTVKDSSSKYFLGEYADFDGMKVGMLKNNENNIKFDNFSKKNGFTYESKFYDSAENLWNALQKEEVEAIATSNLRKISKERIIAEFAPAPFYAVVEKGNTKLLNELNDVLEKINILNPTFQTLLYQKYYDLNLDGEIAFTAVEKKYIKSNPNLEIILPPSRMPLIYTKDDKVCGIVPSIIKKALGKANFKIKFTTFPTAEDYVNNAKNEKYQVKGLVFNDVFEAESNDERLSMPYLTSSYNLVSLADHKENDLVFALVNNVSVTKKYVEKHYSQSQIKFYENEEECVDAIIKGYATHTIMNTYNAEYLIKNDVRNRLVTNLIMDFETSFTMSVKDNADYLLFSIINKCVGALTQEDVRSIIVENTFYQSRKLNLLEFIYVYPVRVISVSLAFIFVAVVLFVLIYRQRRLKKQQKKEAKSRGQLMDALNLAKASNEAKSTFMSRMSHEIRTPLNAVIGYMTIAKNNTQNIEKVNDCISKCEVAGKHLLSIINDVLDMSSIESGKLKIARERFDFKELILNLSSIYYMQCETKGIKFEVINNDVTEDFLIGDKLRLNQILLNLLSNAVKFTNENGKIFLIISQKAIKDEKVFIDFTVSDTGIGMTEEFMQKLFIPFEQQDASISQKFGGTGIGLCITKNLVTMMNGAINVESKEKVGTTFSVELPFERDVTIENIDEVEHDFSDVKVLIVDDEPNTCEYMKILMDRIGLQSDYATTGKIAIEKITQAKNQEKLFDMCLIDWKMPDMDGVETVRKIRQCVGNDMPIIIISAYDFFEIEDEAKKAGVNLFISKPLFQSAMLDLLVDTYGKYKIKNIDKKETQTDFKGKRLLLAEDNEMNREIATEILKTFGFIVESAVDGEKVVEIFENSEEGTYDAILMDIQMPIKNGYEATIEIRQSSHKDATTIPIIAMTANAFSEDIASSHQAGMNDHISKPIDIEQMILILKKYI